MCLLEYSFYLGEGSCRSPLRHCLIKASYRPTPSPPSNDQLASLDLQASTCYSLIVSSSACVKTTSLNSDRCWCCLGFVGGDGGGDWLSESESSPYIETTFT